MVLTKLHDPSDGQLRAAGFMSGKGTNLRRIIELEKQLRAPLYHIAVIFSDSYSSNAVALGKDYDLPVIVRDRTAFCDSREKMLDEVRVEFDLDTILALNPYELAAVAYCGYMTIASQPLVDAFLGINVHPADLSITENGVRKYIGRHPVRDAILSGEKCLRSTTHIVEAANCRPDTGKILMISPEVKVQLPEGFDPKDRRQLKKTVDENQSRLKECGDWVIFPKTLRYIAEGRYSKDENGDIYFDEKPLLYSYS